MRSCSWQNLMGFIAGAAGWTHAGRTQPSHSSFRGSASSIGAMHMQRRKNDEWCTAGCWPVVGAQRLAAHTALA